MNKNIQVAAAMLRRSLQDVIRTLPPDEPELHDWVANLWDMLAPELDWMQRYGEIAPDEEERWTETLER